jgi:pimeloyl-[acyl-carrier protein] methyl ester esterase
MTVFVDVVGRGPNLTLLHGWGMNSAVWNGVREQLATHYTLHLIDLPGHGRSAGAPVTTRDAMVDAIAHAMPAQTNLLGWSLGGHVSLALAHRYPQRIERLITVGSTPRFVAADDWPYGKKAEVLADFAKRLSTSYSATIRNFLALQVLNQPDMRDHIREVYDAVNAHGAPAVAGLAAALDILRVSDVRGLVPNIQAPALVMHGDHDALTAEPAARWLAEHLPNSTYCLMEHAAHAPFLSHREAFLEHLTGFLSA